ncbi:MAG: PatB family C-S lyase [Lentisphaeraceae bacterium]|nr:PatB family C-S lyase [Lentisphaeraceae bacterium]
MNFDKVSNRRPFGSMKWNKFPEDVTPLWVADMDFEAPSCVRETLKSYVDHNIYGYSLPQKELIGTVIDMLKEKYAWEVKPSSIVWLPGLVPALNIAARGCVQNNREIFTHTPVYPPFLTAPILSNRKLKTNDMVINNGRFEIDYKKMDNDCSLPTELYYLCNPQNPTGRAFDRKELEKIAETCLKNDMFICSDDIHCELILDDKKHIPIATLSKEIEDITITLMAPSKTYNIPGLCFSFAVIPNYKLRKRFIRAMQGIVPYPGIMGIAGAVSAYKGGEEWRLELLKYLRANRSLVSNFISQHMPDIKYIPGEATYLAWLDMRALNLENPFQYFLKNGVGLSDGKEFHGEGFLRLNFGCPKSTLLEGLEKMKLAYDSI